MNPEQFTLSLKQYGIHLNEHQLIQFDTYYQMLKEWNEKINLTALVSKEDVYLKHFYDSISAGFYYNFNKNVDICDVGAGAGFPSIPLKICFPHIKVSIVDSLQKRIGFLRSLVERLEIDHVALYHSRAEDFGQKKKQRESFDIVMARAVAKMSVLSELCLPLTKVNGFFIAMKGSQVNEELSNSEKAIKTLGGNIKQVQSFKLPTENSARSIVLINKIRKTPRQFPRKAGTPNKSPIQ